jgi:hypothetical protein
LSGAAARDRPVTAQRREASLFRTLGSGGLGDFNWQAAPACELRLPTLDLASKGQKPPTLTALAKYLVSQDLFLRRAKLALTEMRRTKNHTAI